MSRLTGQHFILKFSEENAFLCPEVALDLNQVQVPPSARRFLPAAYWTIKVLHHNVFENKLFVQVLNYNPGDTDFPPHQESCFDDLLMIEKVTFKSIDTDGLLRTIKQHGYVTNRQLYLPQSGPDKTEPGQELGYDDEDEEISPPNVVSDDNEQMDYETHNPESYVIEETISVPLKNVRFKMGAVSFKVCPKGFWMDVEFEIINYDIREEFDAVKNYFANVLKTKKIDVQIRLETKLGEVISTQASSPQIAMINQKLIENVKFEFVKDSMRKRVKVEVDKSLFTMDEYFESLAERGASPGGMFRDENDLMEYMMNITGTKHYKHLRYLSSLHAHRVMKLRFVLKPLSFIFLVEGEKDYHIIWETLDTEEATWIWHSEKNKDKLKQKIHKIEDILNVIKVQGKVAYINSGEDNFRRIFHDYSDIVEGFVKWKGEMDRVLT